MAAAVPTKEPTEFFAGDYVTWTKSLSDFPSSTYTLTYRLLALSGAAATTVSASASGTDFQIIIHSASSATFTPGDYSLIGFVSDGTERTQIYSGKLIVKPDPATATAFDGRTYLEKVLIKLEEVILSGVIRAPIEYSYGGVSSKIMTLKDALDARDRIRAQMTQEAALIHGHQRRILTRFKAPR